MIRADLIAAAGNADDAAAVGKFQDAIWLTSFGQRVSVADGFIGLLVEDFGVLHQLEGLLFFLRLKEDLDAFSGHGRMSEKADEQPGGHHVTGFLDEEHWFTLKIVNERLEVGLMRKWAIGRAGAGF